MRLRLKAIPALFVTGFAQSREFSLTPDGAWTKAKEPLPGSDEAILAQARIDISNRKFYDARRALDQFIELHENTTNAFLPEAYLLRGDTKYYRGWEESALRDYQTVVQQYPSSEAFVKALEQEHKIGKAYLNGLKRRILWIRMDSGESWGQEILIRVYENLPDSRLGEQAVLDLIDYYYRKPDLKAAIEVCRAYLGWKRDDTHLLGTFAGHVPAPRPPRRNEMYVRMRLIQATVLRFAGPRYNASPLEDAKLLIDQFTNDFPAEAERTGIGDAMAARVDELLAQQMLETAGWYVRRGDNVAARYTYRKLVRKYQETVAASQALDILTRRGWGLGEGASIDSRHGSNAPGTPRENTTGSSAPPGTEAREP
jgi:outer membrane protein assembly factor BamD (BamD/ComL family)